MSHAGFWKRVAAFLVDSFIYAIFRAILAFLLGLVLVLIIGPEKATQASQSALTRLASVPLALVCFLVYYVWTESSAWQATIGKKLLGLKVTDVYGRRLSFWRSLGRNVSMFVSTLTLGIGYLMCIWTAKKQCLHDKMANCLVVDQTPGQKNGCVISVIVAWILMMLVFAGMMMLAAAPQFQQALDHVRAAQEQLHQREAQMQQIQDRLRQEIEKTDFSQLDSNE